MSSENGKPKREILPHFRVSAEEENLIKTKMERTGLVSMSAYLRKMAVIKLGLREMIFFQRRSSNNLNQIAKRVNSTGRIYAEDMEKILRWQEKLWQCANDILKKLAAIA